MSAIGRRGKKLEKKSKIGVLFFAQNPMELVEAVSVDSLPPGPVVDAVFTPPGKWFPGTARAPRAGTEEVFPPLFY